MVEDSMTEEFQRMDPPPGGMERELLAAFLDYQRATLLRKIDGLGDADLRRQVLPSTLTLLGMVKHLAYVEQSWFGIRFAGEDLPVPYTKADPDADFRIEPGETTTDIVALYKREVARSRAILSASSLDDLAKAEGFRPSLRWIALHMIEETARHNGHADLIREAIDGATGE